MKRLRRFRCRQCRPGMWLHCAGLAIVLTMVLSVDQEQQRRARIVEQGLGVSYSGSSGEESVRWLNMLFSAVWTPLQKTISGLGEELATLATFTLTATEHDALSIAFENVTWLVISTTSQAEGLLIKHVCIKQQHIDFPPTYSAVHCMCTSIKASGPPQFNTSAVGFPTSAIIYVFDVICTTSSCKTQCTCILYDEYIYLYLFAIYTLYELYTL